MNKDVGVCDREDFLIGPLICELYFRGSVRLVWGFGLSVGFASLGWELMVGCSGFAMGKGFMIHGHGFHGQGVLWIQCIRSLKQTNSICSDC